VFNADLEVFSVREAEDECGDNIGAVCIDNLLVRIHLIIEMILVDRSCDMGLWIPSSR